MNDPHTDDLSWDSLNWQDIQAIGAALADRHEGEDLLILSPERVADLLADIPGCRPGGGPPDDFILSAIITAWIAARMGEDDSSPFDHLA